MLVEDSTPDAFNTFPVIIYKVGFRCYILTLQPCLRGGFLFIIISDLVNVS